MSDVDEPRDVGDKIKLIIDQIIATEQGFVDHPSDRGGPTMYGITEAVAHSFEYRGGMNCLPLSLARHIYKTRYIVTPGFDHVVSIDEEVGLEVIDTGVNSGPVVAAIMLQRWLNGFNSKGHYSDLFIDGKIGPVSIDALKVFLSWRGKKGKLVLLRGLNATQGTRFLEITEANKSQRDFLFGWIAVRTSVE
jgi:lysozyme family protein